MTAYSNVASIKVSPGIGIGRVGNSNEYFIGPETPDNIPLPDSFTIAEATTGTEPGKYKDASGRVKRQAQRFRVYGYNCDGSLLGEIVQGDSVNGKVVSLDWEVHVTNMKAANYAFQGQYVFNPDDLRNSTVQPGIAPHLRDKLIIDPGAMNISGVSQGPLKLVGKGSTIFDLGAGYTSSLSNRLKFDPPQSGSEPVSVTYTPATVSLGDLRTDADGRLIFIGGAGTSRSCTSPSVVISKVIETPEVANPEYNGNSYFNNPGWYDDTCGGSINVTLKTGDTSVLSTVSQAVNQGWIAVTPPHYAPATYNVVSLLDLQLDIYPNIDPNTGKGPISFAQEDSGKLYVGTSTTGSANSLAPTVVTSDLTFATAPALAVHNGVTNIAISDTTNLLYNGVDNGNGYTFKQIIDAPKISAPAALTVLNDILYYAVNSFGDLYISAKDSADIKFNKFTAPGFMVNADQAPTLTTFNGALFYGAIDVMGRIHLASSLTDSTLINFVFAPIGNTTLALAASNLSLTVYAGKLYCAYIGNDNDLYLGVSSDGISFSFINIALADTTSASGVALSAFNNQIYYSVGLSGGVMLGASSDGKTFTFAAVSSSTSGAPALVTNISVNFYRDIYPILKTVTDYAWTNELAFHGHGPGKKGDFLSATHITGLENPSIPGEGIIYTRPFVFNFIRPPVQDIYLGDSVITIPPPPLAALPVGTPANTKVTNGGQQQRADLMPRLFGNGGSPSENDTNGTAHPNQWLSLTNHQLEKFQQWVNGNFEQGETTDTQWQGLAKPEQHDFSALQPTVGGGFHPGIELTYLMAYEHYFDSAFRFKAATLPGSIAAYMSVPWQGDFWSCNISWWPSLRPDIVVESSNDTPPVLSQTQWFRGNEIPPNSNNIADYQDGYSIMLESWSDLGYVTPTGEMNLGQLVFAESERNTRLNGPSLIVSIKNDNLTSGSALEFDGSAIETAPIVVGTESQKWNLVENTNAVEYFYIQYKGIGIDQNKVLTAAFDGTLTLETQQIPPSSDQKWQYNAAGYPGQFNISNPYTMKLLTTDTAGTVSLAVATTGLQQLWLLDVSTTKYSLILPKGAISVGRLH